MDSKQAREYVKIQSVAPDDLVINGKAWKLESTYLTRGEALGSADYLPSYKLYKYANGYALYERSY